MQNSDLTDIPNLSEFSRAVREARGLSSGFADDLGAATRHMRNMDDEAKRLSRSLSSSLRSAFDKAVFGGEKLGDVLRGLASDVIGSTLDAALRPVHGAIGSGVSGAVGALSGAIGSAFAFRDGGAFSSGRVRAFASGGVVALARLAGCVGGVGGGG